MPAILLLSLFIINSAFAWELKTENKKVHLLDKSKKIDEVVMGSQVETVQVKKLNNDYTLLTYFESEAGTKVTVKNYNCAVYSESKKKIVLKDKLCKTVSEEGTENASFTVSGTKLIYQFEELKQEIN